MIVKELIKQLQQIEDQNCEIFVSHGDLYLPLDYYVESCYDLRTHKTEYYLTTKEEYIPKDLL